MNIDWHAAALALAGLIGAGVAVVHGVLTQRLMVRPFNQAVRSSDVVHRLVPMLLHMSTIVWFVGGVMLIAAAFWFTPGAKLAAGLFVGSLFLYGALGNFWGTRGRHPGWVGMAAALALIAFSLIRPGA